MLKPLFMEPYFNIKDWGGTRLASVYGKRIPSDHTGESWEVSAHPMGVSRCEGKTLPEWIDEYGAALCGTEVQGEFPLLIKLIDAREWLSVPVHPDDAYALAEENEYGKNEMWYVLEHEEGAGIYCGFRRDVSRQEVEDALEDGTILFLLTESAGCFDDKCRQFCRIRAAALDKKEE